MVMGIVELLLIAVGVAGDAFAVSICKGVTATKKVKTAVICGVWFALFQMLMPLVGYFLGTAFLKYIEKFDHWIVFALLLILGAKMIKETLSNGEEHNKDDVSFKTMLPLALATSIDALAVGVTFAIVKTNIWVAISIVGAVTFAFCVVGGMIGQKLGERNKKIAGIFAGIILIVLGIKILIEHLFF